MKSGDELWSLDSRCSRYMSRNKYLFTRIKKTKYRSVTFSDNRVSKVIGIGMDPSKSLENVYLVEDENFIY